MSFEETATVSEPAVAQATPPSPLSLERSNAADKAENTAPSAGLAREAFDRLAGGETPADVNRELYGKGKAAPREEGTSPNPSKPGPMPDKPDSPESKPQPEPQNKWPEGFSSRDLNVLQRAQLDPETWAAIPPSNQKKILANLRESQSAADREFQRNRQAAGEAKPSTSTGSARTQSPPPTQTPTDTADEATPDESQEDERIKPASEGKPSAPATDLAGLLDPRDLETLKLIGGDDLAETYQRGIGRVAEHFQRQNSQLLGVTEFLLGQFIEGQFDAAVKDLRQTPGFDELSPQSLTALRGKADLLHRAAGDPKGYSYRDAVQDAAASLFKTNLHQTAQSQLLASRNKSLAGSPDRGDGRRNSPRPLTTKERNAAIFAQLSQGLTPDQARMAVDGS